MRRQVSRLKWEAKLASLPKAEAEALVIALASAQSLRYTESTAIAKAYYRDKTIDKAQFIVQDNASIAKFETFAIANGYYEDVTLEDIHNEERQALVDAIKLHNIAGVLSAVTSIANYYRNKQGKDDLTEQQVKTRLLA